MRLSTAGLPVGLGNAVVGRVALQEVSLLDRSDTILVTNSPQHDTSGYAGIVTSARPEEFGSARSPMVAAVRDIDHLRTDDLVVLEPGTGHVRTLFRPDSAHNGLFMTERCNSNCLMCSQPPKDHDDADHFVSVNRRLISLIPPATPYLGITGGEPTLLGEGLLTILRDLRERLPDTDVHMLTNGRLFAWKDFTERFAASAHHNLTLGIPLYAPTAQAHDHVVQARHAFDQTVMGLHNLARWRQRVEIRIVLHKLTIPHLNELALYIYRNFPFVVHVAFMGMEPIGYMPRNKDELWINPADYQDELESAIEMLSIRGMQASIYNLQLCTVRPSLWKYARKSIADWKNVYLPACQECAARTDCGGLFQWQAEKYGTHLQPIQAQALSTAVPQTEALVV